MTPKEKIISVSPDDEVEKAAKVFVDTPVHRLLVMENGKIVGIVSTKDVMKGLLKKIGKLD
jgi:predicted transcriptional regulator